MIIMLPARATAESVTNFIFQFPCFHFADLFYYAIERGQRLSIF